MSNDNLCIWEKVNKTDPKFTTSFNNGSFKGTSIDIIYNIKRATEMWGPMGHHWGYTELEVIREHGIWWTKIEMYYPANYNNESQEVTYGRVSAWGGTKYMYTTKNGRQMLDEDAPKKSATDALSKSFSLLGFSSDVYMGLFDDDKYVRTRMQEEHIKSKMNSQEYDIYKNELKNNFKQYKKDFEGPLSWHELSMKVLNEIVDNPSIDQIKKVNDYIVNLLQLHENTNGTQETF